ncbi:hypothetical protein MBGDF03_00594, partial [Thermoplasmatales archaeon SCGC AB-540-F20]
QMTDKAEHNKMLKDLLKKLENHTPE